MSYDVLRDMYTKDIALKQMAYQQQAMMGIGALGVGHATQNLTTFTIRPEMQKSNPTPQIDGQSKVLLLIEGE